MPLVDLGSGVRGYDGRRVELVDHHRPRQLHPRWQVVVVGGGPEDEARRVYADTISSADEHGYASVKLTRDGVDVETWPQATGWTV